MSVPGTDGDTIGCAVAAIAVVAGGWWLYNNYEIVERTAQAPLPPRPVGRIEVGTLPNKDVWRLLADDVTGPRDARQIWISQDHSKNAAVTARETVSLYRVNCGTLGYRTLSVVEYDKDGKVIQTWGTESFGESEDFAPPDTYIGDALEAGCDPAFDPPPTPSND